MSGRRLKRCKQGPPEHGQGYDTQLVEFGKASERCLCMNCALKVKQMFASWRRA